MKPPFPAVAGAWALPTLLNNVETFSAIPPIIQMAAKRSRILACRRPAERGWFAFRVT